MTNLGPSSPTDRTPFAALVEAWGPLVVGGITAGAALLWAWNRPLPSTLSNLLNATVGVSAIAIGFLATAKSMLFSMNEKWVVVQLRRIGYFKRLMDYFMRSIRWSFVLAILSSVGLLIDLQGESDPHPWLFAIWVFVVMETALCSYRVIHLFSKILRSAE